MSSLFAPLGTHRGRARLLIGAVAAGVVFAAAGPPRVGARGDTPPTAAAALGGLAPVHSATTLMPAALAPATPLGPPPASAAPVGENDEGDEEGNANANAPSETAPRMVTATPQAASLVPAHTRRAEYVIIISEDGLRGSALAELNLPRHEALYRKGSYTWRARTIRTASTLPSHAAMLSGFDVEAHGLTWNNWRPDRGFIKVPSIFEDAELYGLKSAMFVGKMKLKHITRPGAATYFDRPGYFCKNVAAEAAEYIVRERPPLTFVHFSNPDDAGHAKGWTGPDYDHAVGEDDKCLGVILDALDRSGMADSTLVIISADHGGHNHTHSGSCLIDREIPWIARGPGVRENYRIRGAISTTDTAATALDALGLPMPPDAVGRVVSEIYE